MQQYILRWLINGRHGEGNPSTDKEALESWVYELNKKYGEGTHWLDRWFDKEKILETGES